MFNFFAVASPGTYSTLLNLQLLTLGVMTDNVKELLYGHRAKHTDANWTSLEGGSQRTFKDQFLYNFADYKLTRWNFNRWRDNESVFFIEKGHSKQFQT